MTVRALQPILKAVAVALFVAVAAAVWAQAPAPAAPRPPVWEVVSSTDAAAPAASGEVEVVVREGGIVLIKSDHEVKVQVFSILGQLITEKQIQPGIVRLRMNTRGIYILKADNSTRRISL